MLILSIAKLSNVDHLMSLIRLPMTWIQSWKKRWTTDANDSPFPNIVPLSLRMLTELEQLTQHTVERRSRVLQQRAQVPQRGKSSGVLRVSSRKSLTRSDGETRSRAKLRTMRSGTRLWRIDEAAPACFDVARLNAIADQCAEMERDLEFLQSAIRTELDRFMADRPAVITAGRAEVGMADTLTLLAVLTESYPTFNRLKLRSQWIDRDLQSVIPTSESRPVIETAAGLDSVSDRRSTHIRRAPVQGSPSQNVPASSLPSVVLG